VQWGGGGDYGGGAIRAIWTYVGLGDLSYDNRFGRRVVPTSLYPGHDPRLLHGGRDLRRAATRGGRGPRG
jgi:hypothetical protein